MQRTDVIVLGAGMVGVSAALHLQQRGRSVVLVDRRGPGEETSYGNAGIIQREGVVPYPFPRDISPDGAVRVQPAAGVEPALERAAQRSRRGCSATGAPRRPNEVAKTARGARPLVERCIIEHEALMGEAGVLGLVRRTGYMRVYRSAQALEAALRQGARRSRNLRGQLRAAGRGQGRRAGAASEGRRWPAAC